MNIVVEIDGVRHKYQHLEREDVPKGYIPCEDCSLATICDTLPDNPCLAFEDDDVSRFILEE